LHATNGAALHDEKIISQPQRLLLKETPGCAGRFGLDVRQTAALFKAT
jgi:hypothetical protein